MKKNNFLKKISLFLFAVTTLCILGGVGVNMKTASAIPCCNCTNPNIEVVMHEGNFTRYHCTNCHWFCDIRR